MPKTVIMLIGPKGSGKTHIGTVAEKLAGIHFLSVEKIWLTRNERQNGWEAVERAIDVALETCDRVIIESLGGSSGFESMRRNLAAKYLLRYVRIVVPLEVCLERARYRDGSNQIPISLDRLKLYNRLASQVSLPWDIEIKNSPPLDDAQILRYLRRVQ